MPEALSLQPAASQAWIDRLEAMGLSVRQRLVAVRSSGTDLAQAVAQEGGDTIFAIDRMVEDAIERHIDAWPDACKPLLLIAEGLGADGQRLFSPHVPKAFAPGFAEGRPRFCLLVDPIDGTRNIMYDKRSAWFLAVLTPGTRPDGTSPTLADALVSVIVELPTSKAGWADGFTAMAGQPARGRRRRIAAPGYSEGAAPVIEAPLALDHLLAPSRATTLLNGFAQVSNFFPGTKVLAAQLMERVVQGTLGDVAPGSAAVFDDQYLTTAGQMVELMLGHDRFCCDLRPLFYDILEKRSAMGVRGQGGRGLECHPYDCAGMLVARQAGVILTDGFGRPLDAPLSVHHGVHWCGYANAALRAQIEPVIVAWLMEQGLNP
jgi:hypothetical protein